MKVLLYISLFSLLQTNAIGAFKIPRIFRRNARGDSTVSIPSPNHNLTDNTGSGGLKNPGILRREDRKSATGKAKDGICESVDIQQLPVFKSLLPSDVNRLMDRLEKLESDEGEVIIVENDRDNDMYFISEGEVECYHEKKPKHSVKTLGPGDNVGELALFFGTPRALSVRIKSKKAVLWKLTKDSFDSSVKDTEISDDVILSLLKRTYSDEKTWVNLPKMTFADGKTHASWERPHTHAGKFEAYVPSKLLVKDLDVQAEKVLKEGGSYKHSLGGKYFNRIVVVQDVEAPVKAVLNEILDYNNYNKKVPQTLESEVYNTKSNGDVDTFFTRLKTGMRGFSMEFFVKSEYHKKHNSVVWCLDYEKLSEIDEACGYWRAEPHPSFPDEKTRLHYSVDMSLGSNVVGCVASYINKKAANDAVAW
eukprot:CAMPEP_0194200958 /NCGR_PEP_ID=MMETSP0156-20130528/1368_1 /TAXON_ID=33649 /ORGANISM="Thalassionema nitzschioides, Strain L26-B" /LENGTH=420 /DNA_ID=CAMNT_0038926033 /DNA_START=31 /DNA_END=1290 /DNA_ORIENTATION=-